MPTELNLRFPDASHVIIRLGSDDDSGQLPFTNPITDKDLRDIRWYVETYGAHSLGDPDDQEAARIAGELPVWGKKLFEAVFQAREATRRFINFQNAEEDTRLLTISAEHPAIHALPWELLHDPAPGGGFLFMETPRISIRRRVAGASGGRTPFKPVVKDTLHLLFVVSRPDDAGFLDPRADSRPVLDAIDEHARGRVACEFLRPPTLDALIERLEDTSKPPVDILHFDGHGVFDREGGLPKRMEEARAARIAHRQETLRDKQAPRPHDPDYPPNTGYLLFEKTDGQSDLVSAGRLGANLHRRKVAVVILSACQSAAVGEDEQEEDGQVERPMGSVAARLTATGIPSVLAMTHSVLVPTTRALFGEFYKELARHKGIGEALDNARRYLANHPEKYKVQRGPNRVPLKLYDWFLPALYQQGADGALLQKSEVGSQKSEGPRVLTNLPLAPEAGFFGRKRKLWEIERWVVGPTRRITITGFGGQGKSAFAQEAGRWLTRTGFFQAAVFVDYSRVQARDAVTVAVINLGSVLGESLLDANAATAALKKTPTLVILDNLEALASDSLRALLDAAVAWSEADGSRVLCTTRQPDFGHAAYKIEGALVHRRIQLDGLGSKQSPDDALEWYAALMKLPPAPTVPPPWPEALIELFDLVKFHPLSIRVLAQQLKTCRPAGLGERLDELLAVPSPGGPAAADEDAPAGLLASLEFSLDKLDEAARQVLPRLGVFRGGAFEDHLLDVTGLGGGKREELENQLASVEKGWVSRPDGTQVPQESIKELKAHLHKQLAELPGPSANLWPGLRRQLEAAALIEAEEIPGVGVPFLRFHPTLAPMLRVKLDVEERTRLSAAHRQRYCALSGQLYQEDSRDAHRTRAIVWCELPNLLHAVHAAFDAGNPDAAVFAANLIRFLGDFGLTHEAECLVARTQQEPTSVKSTAWYSMQCAIGEQLRTAGQPTQARRIYEDILGKLDPIPKYERAHVIREIGRCHVDEGHPEMAVPNFHVYLAFLGKLDPTSETESMRGGALADLGTVEMRAGHYAEARKALEQALKIAIKHEMVRDRAVAHANLGTLAYLQQRWPEAAHHHSTARALFHDPLKEPNMEAACLVDLGKVLEKEGRWDKAEQHYRDAASTLGQDNPVLQAIIWTQLAGANERAGRVDLAAQWHQKAADGFRDGKEPAKQAVALMNLAALLQTQACRLTEARQTAEEALAIKQTLDPGAAEIWKTYNILAQIAESEAAPCSDARQVELQAQARDHRRLARETYCNFDGSRIELQQQGPLIVIAVAAFAGEVKAHKLLSKHQATLRQGGSQGTAFALALDRLLAGELDETTLLEGLDALHALIIETILACLADPSKLNEFPPSEETGPS